MCVCVITFGSPKWGIELGDPRKPEKKGTLKWLRLVSEIKLPIPGAPETSISETDPLFKGATYESRVESHIESHSMSQTSPKEKSERN